ncbi:MAG: IS1595 family transposase [Deltaproteobacteria bacterium]|nr:IS1595 family transposase [Deltaproteobacteria bacterium]
MEDYPRTLGEFDARFGSEEACRAYLFQLRWPDGFVCPRCQATTAWGTKRALIVCGSCGYQASVTAGTIFEGTHKPLRMWLYAIWWVTSQRTGASALGLQRVLGLGSYYTAWTWLHKLRRAMVRPGRNRISGVVEVDEFYIGGEKSGKRGRGAAGKTLVVIAAQINGTRIGRIRLRRVPDASAKSLEDAIRKGVEPGSALRTDGWKGYHGLNRIGYIHDVVREEADVGDSLLPCCHRVASLLKRWMMGTHQGAISHEHLDYYLDEYTFRFNRRTSCSRGKLFYRLIQQAVAVEASPYKTMVKHVRGRRPNRHNM